jgi:SpoVK/Ycf46/Vps4 family AAA+-type ATPase
VVLKGGRLTLEDCEISHDLSVLPDLTDVHTMGGVFTAIRTRFTRAFAGGGTVRLQDLEIRGSSAANRLSVKNGATVALTDVRVRSEGEGDCPPVWMEKGRLTLEDCTIVHDAEATPDLADLWVAGGEVFCERTTLDRIKALAGTTRLSDVTFTLLLAESGGRIISESTLHHHAPVRERFAVMVEDGSRVGLDRVVSDDEEFAVRVAGGSFALMSLEGPGPDGQYVRVDEKATLEGMALGMRRQDLNANPLTSGGPVGGVGGGGARDGGADGSDDQPASADGDAGGDPVARPSSADPADPTDQPSPASPADPMVEIEAMTGLVTVKKQIRSFLQTVEFNRAREAQGLRGIDLTLHSVFLGGPGTGKTTVARLFGKALHQAGVIPTDTFKEVDAEGLVSANIGETPTKTRAVLEQARGGVLFVDEAYTLYQESGTNYGTQAVDTILKFMEDNRREIVVIFAGYPAKMQDFLNMNPGLRSRVANEFTFEDYTPDEIVTMGLNMLAADGYTVNEELYGQVIRRKYATASERSNGRWVRNRNEELLKVLIGRVIGGGGDGGAADTSTILDEDLYAFGGGDATSKEQKVAELLAELDAMVGLAPVKEFVHDLVVQVRADQKLMRAGLTPSQPTYHMVFEGEPGTGKTTVARIIAEVFHALGILDRPDVIEVERKDLVGAYIGHTEKQTARAIDQAMGGVLFVDEAYQLTPEEGSGGSGNDFGKLAVETLITALEDKRSSFVAIFAGYTRPMERFLNQNPGLRSRVPHRIVFPDYTPGEIGTIVAARLGKQWQFDADLVRSVAAACYEATPPEERANGRWARTFAERIEKAHRHWILDHDVPAEDLARIDDQVVQGFAPSE